MKTLTQNKHSKNPQTKRAVLARAILASRATRQQSLSVLTQTSEEYEERIRFYLHKHLQELTRTLTAQESMAPTHRLDKPKASRSSPHLKTKDQLLIQLPRSVADLLEAKGFSFAT